MKLYLLRHAIAEMARPGSDDGERALTADGRKKLKEVLRVARAAEAHPTLIMTSPYKRAVQTAEIAADVLGYRAALYTTKALLPMAAAEEVWDEIRTHNDQAEILLVGHEPSLGLLLGFLLGAPSLAVDFKKGGMGRVDVDSFGVRPRGVLKWLLAPKLASG